MKDKKIFRLWVAMSLVAVLAVFVSVSANSNQVVVNEGGVYNENNYAQNGVEDFGNAEPSFGALSDTVRPARLYTAQNLAVVEQTELNGTTTQEILVLNSVFTDTTAAGSVATSTGGVASIQWTQGNQVCEWDLKITGAVDEGGARVSIATSTSATQFTSGSAANLLASTTIATGTTPFLSSVDKGVSNAKRFELNNGNYIHTSLSFTDPAASSTSYDTMSAKLYLTKCVSK